MLCLVVCGSVHLVVQITLFLTLFLLLCDTFLFQVGLLGVLFAHFRAVLILQPIYVVYTLLLDGYRIVSPRAPSPSLSDALITSQERLKMPSPLPLLLCCVELPDEAWPRAQGPVPGLVLPAARHRPQARYVHMAHFTTLGIVLD